MSFAAKLDQAVTIQTPAVLIDRRQNAQADWSTATETTTVGWLAQTSGTETRDGRDAQVSGWLLYLPADASIDATCRVVVGGVTYEVDGPPVSARRPGYGVHHVEAKLKLAKG